MKGITGIILVLIGVACWTVPLVRHIKFDMNCGDYLGRASIASSVEMAVAELDTAIKYLESNNMTKGYTSVVYNTPDEDVGFFYNNLVSARRELSTLPDTATQLEKTNTLMKLRETLIYDSGKGGAELDVPCGISQFPYNGFIAFIIFLGFVCFFTGCIAIAVQLYE